MDESNFEKYKAKYTLYSKEIIFYKDTFFTESNYLSAAETSLFIVISNVADSTSLSNDSH